MWTVFAPVIVKKGKNPLLDIFKADTKRALYDINIPFTAMVIDHACDEATDVKLINEALKLTQVSLN